MLRSKIARSIHSIARHIQINSNHFTAACAVCAGLTNVGLAQTTAVYPRTEYKINPTGLDAPAPRLSWRLETKQDGTRQVAYEIRAASQPDELTSGGHLRWETGRVESGATNHIPYAGEPLQSRDRIHWQVRVWDNHGNRSAWSEVASWEMGLRSPADWQAEWIESDIPPAREIAQPPPYFRTEFELTKAVKNARLYITSHGLYEAYLNGKKVGDELLTPGWTSYNKRLQYQTYDITEQLNPGKNALGAIVGDGWFRGPVDWGKHRFHYGDTLALLAQLEVTFTDGTSAVFCSDKNWETSTGAILTSDLYDGEIYDARNEPEGWAYPGFDDSDWNTVTVKNHAKTVLVAPCGPPVRAVEEIKPVSMTSPEGQSVIFDFGQNMVGHVRLRIEGRTGETITLRHSEVLDQKGMLYTENLREADQTIRYTCKGSGTEVFAPHFTFQGFRYVEMSGHHGRPSLETLTGIVVHSDMRPTSTFQSSDPELNQLHHNILWGMKDNFVDIPTDSPQRDERRGWTGDAQVFASTACYLMETAPFYAKWMQDMSADQLDSGLIPHYIPDLLGKGGSSGWGDAAVIIPWAVYQAYGDKRILEENYSCMLGWVRYSEERAGDNLIWDRDWHWGDWLSYKTERSDYHGASTDKGLISTAFFAHSTDLLARIAAILGKAEDAANLAALHQRIVASFQHEFVTPSGRLVSHTQTAYALALTFEMIPEDLCAASAGHLASDVEKFGHLTTGFLGTPLLNPTLSAFGYDDLAYMLLMRREYPSWLYPVSKGATTIWERWDGIKPDGSFQKASMNSFNHYSYGAVGSWIYGTIGGIQATSPGYRTFRIKPVIGGGLTHATTTFASLHGTIESAWEIVDNQLVMTVTVPPNTEALIEVPAPGGRNSVKDASEIRDTLTYMREENGYVVYKAESGTYRFEAVQ